MSVNAILTKSIRICVYFFKVLSYVFLVSLSILKSQFIIPPVSAIARPLTAGIGSTRPVTATIRVTVKNVAEELMLKLKLAQKTSAMKIQVLINSVYYCIAWFVALLYKNS